MKYLYQLLFKITHHLLLLLAIGQAFFLYSDDYDIFPWATHDESLKFLNLIFVTPILIIGSILIDLFVEREESNIGRIHYYLLKNFPLACFFLISGYFFLIVSLNSILLAIGLGITAVLLIIEIYLMIYDLRGTLNPHPSEANSR